MIRTESICLGTEKNNLTQALMLTSLPAKLKKKSPHLKVYASSRGFSSVVFQNNPYIDGIRHFAREVLSKEILSLNEDSDSKPALYLTQTEEAANKKFILERQFPSLTEKPLCLLHAWKNTKNQAAPVEFWDQFVARWRNDFHFWQVGLENDSAIQGCEFYYFLQPRPSNARKLFALVKNADLFIGIDSAPMHVAQTFDKPSLILLNHLAPRPGTRRDYLYPHIEYARVGLEQEKLVKEKMDQFVSTFKKTKKKIGYSIGTR